MNNTTRENPHLNGPEAEESLSGVLNALNGRPHIPSSEGFEHLSRLLPTSMTDPRRDIEFMPDKEWGELLPTKGVSELKELPKQFGNSFILYILSL